MNNHPFLNLFSNLRRRCFILENVWHGNANSVVARTIHCSRLCAKQNNENKRVQDKIIKMLSSRKNLRKKFYDNSNIDQNFINSVQFGQGKVKRSINSNVLIRERNVSSVLVTQIQEIIDTGIACPELSELQFKITGAVMNNKDSCSVYWDTQGSDRDHIIHEVLTKYSKHIRHILMHSFVICHVPNLYFHLDDQAVLMKKLNEIFNSKHFDSGPEADIAETLQDGNAKSSKGKKSKAKSTPSNATLTMFGIDHEAINKIIRIKKEDDQQQIRDNILEENNNNSC